MAEKTQNFGLILPDEEENYDIDVFNSNFTKLDEATADKVVKNPEIVRNTKSKITYDEKGLVTGGEDLLPEDIPNIHVSKIEGRPPIVYINDIPIYGSRFFDIDESGSAVLREDGSGEYILTVLESGEILLRKVVTKIADTLDSDSAKEALSAKQGHILKTLINRVSELLETAKTNITESLGELLDSLNAHKDDINNPHNVTKAQVGLSNVVNVEQASKTDFEAHTGNAQNPHSVTKAQIGLGNADNTPDAEKNVLSATKLTTAIKINGVSFDGSENITIEDDTKIPTAQKGIAGGVAELNENGFVPASQLPSYVDDVIEGTLATFPAQGESGKIYVDTDTDLTYRWSGTQYVEISKSLALGETSSTAYAGNKGKQNAEDITLLKERVSAVESGKANTEYVNDELNKKVDKESYSDDMSLKADLIDGIISDEQLPYYNKMQNVYVNGILLYPTATFVDVTTTGDVYLREDGGGEYLMYIPIDGIPRIKYIGRAITDDVTGVSYSLAISNGVAVLKQIK